jgi:hypothetical protein
MTDKVQEIMALVHKFSVASTQGNAVSAMRLCAEIESKLREVVAPPVPEPTPYCYIYEWDGPFGVHQSTSSARYNGMAPHRSVPVFAAPTEATHTQPASEPVAWENMACAKLGFVRDQMTPEHVDAVQRFLSGDYATPQPATKPRPQPLTDQALEEASRTVVYHRYRLGEIFAQGARFAEWMHGITAPEGPTK